MNQSLRGVSDTYMVEAETDLSRVSSVITILNATAKPVEYTEHKDKVVLACTLSHLGCCGGT